MTGNGLYGLSWLFWSEITAQLFQERRKVVAGLMQVAAQGSHGQEVAPGGAAEAEVDAAGVQCFQGAKLLGNHQRRMVGQHDAAATDADGFGGRSQVPDEHGGGGASQSGDGVMFRQPVALVSPSFHMLREIDGAGDGAGGRFSCSHADQI